ncbi:hypothetical protein GCM10009550_76420 [Actinocorallia libanotica]|uniref:RNA polymerase sigma factor 70 region 4 type 2 domain-containing protein n=1 Tax=Actinocorallia libanotica TaxID=46162 RepID=A0ABN1S0Z3_9ACTN
MVRFLLRSGCERGLAEEIANDASHIVLSRWTQLRADPAYAGKEPINYLLKVAQRRFGLEGPKHERYVTGHSLIDTASTFIDDLFPVLPMPDDGICDLVQDVLLQLPVRDRQVLWLRHAQRFTLKETAEIMTARERNIRLWQANAEARFRSLYEAVLINGGRNGQERI